MNEMVNLGYKVSEEWRLSQYRGKKLNIDNSVLSNWENSDYPEHDNLYFNECVDNLKSKEIFI